MTDGNEIPLFPAPIDDPLFTPEGVEFLTAWLVSFIPPRAIVEPKKRKFAFNFKGTKNE